MLLGFEVRYLAIEWQDPNIVRRLDAAPMPLAIERIDDEYAAEAMIFKDRYAWLGIRGPDLANPPELVTDAGRRALVPVTDPTGTSVWWVLSDGWDAKRKRHVSELRRSAGEFVFDINGERLRIQNRLSEGSGADIQAYVDDFTGNLLWMIVNDAAGATAAGRGGSGNAHLVDVLEGLQEAASRVVASPVVAIRETVDETPVGRVRANAATFRRYAADPAARSLPGRIRFESMDTSENRFLRHMLALCVRWADAWMTGTATGTRFLQDLAETEQARADYNLNVRARAVDPEVFDAQTQSVASRLQELSKWRGKGGGSAGKRVRREIELGNPYGPGPGFFYKPADARGAAASDAVAYRVIHFPEEVRTLVNAVLHVGKRFTFEGTATSTDLSNSSDKIYRQVTFTWVSRVTPHSTVLEERAERRARLEANGWMALLTDVERQELAREAVVAQRRAAKATEKLAALGQVAKGLARVQPKLKALDRALAAKGVRLDGTFPMGMLYVSNPNYAACLRLFKEAEALLRASGLDPSTLEGLQQVGILHASDIYEKWCLLKVCIALLDDFAFEGEPNWIDRLVKAAVTGQRNVRFRFSHRALGVGAELIYQHEAATGVRPDFLLRVRAHAVDPLDPPLATNFVLDAKYRTRWPPQGPRGELEVLCDQKRYGDVLTKGRVFILQPCSTTVRPAASPLGWGRHCEYGAHSNHSKGWIQMRAGGIDAAERGSLKRLLIMALQAAQPEPEQDKYQQWQARSFCVHCGESHGAGSVAARKTRKGMSWTFHCHACRGVTSRTHCYKCETPIFKNGTQWTYHETLADQVTNVICPACEAFFDAANWANTG